jgi:hypothetical protein
MTADEIVRALRDSCAGCNPTPCCEFEVLGPDAADLIESLQSQLSESQRRERAAIKDLSQDAHCALCKHHRSEGGDCIGVSMCAVKGMRVGWEWRGPQAGKGAEE